ncbi:tRNA (cytosine34-2'-O-)-methyltransferase [Caenispirillum salinarum AK4]|uniref:tRNA (cytidine(34)-2'-O)-methyltransferase n=1 Tax=Caenispirillum salinarum AK4 TaxID=1238182 RepID=K9GPL7_9PROT|nr:tRNA (cytidine(34)-2'-O)-methyltransferase [Caenispirillum salinarum]EKV26614.1 tRNA (cytosine34-2'-O-)-methyltransferase [Caenispirillum salinarum AK4]
MRIALYQPDIPQNTGTILRLCACLGVGCDIIEPCGFLFDDRRMRRAGMDYMAQVDMIRHASWRRFLDSRPTRPGGEGRLVLLTTRASVPYTDFAFRADDTLLLGRESAGVPDEVHDLADARVVVPMAEGARSLNVAVSAAMVVGEALRQTGGFATGSGAGSRE